MDLILGAIFLIAILTIGLTPLYIAVKLVYNMLNNWGRHRR
jgi:hypothetical protein